jgi:TatD DNase family protein
MRGYENLDETVAAAARAGVTRIITVGINVPSSLEAVKIARRFSGIFATIGIHPHNVAEVHNDTYSQLQTLAEDKENKIVGYGEIGLDYAKNYAPQDIQLHEFRNQLSIAKELHLPVIIHDREAHEDTIRILDNHKPFSAKGVMHCFSGDSELAWKVIDLGFYISIPGIVTFKNSETLQQVAREIPLNRIILETDGPFLAPVPYRGKTNQPEYLIFTAQKIAELKEISLEEVARETTANAERLFGLNEGETKP